MIQTGNAIISIYTESTPNPETMKFVANKLLFHSKSLDFPDIAAAQVSPLAMELFLFPFVKGVFIASNFVTVTKSEDAEWLDVIPTIKDFLKVYLEDGKLIVTPEYVASLEANNTNQSSESDSDIVLKIKELLETYVKPAVEMDGGAIQFKNYADGVVTVALQGSCSGCPSSMITLKSGIEGMMKRMIPEVKEVITADE